MIDRFDADDSLKEREITTERLNLLHLCGVLADQHLGFGVLEDPSTFVGRTGGIDRDDHRARSRNGHLRVCPLRPGVAQDRHVVSAAQTQIDKPEAELADDARKGTVTEVYPPAVALD